MIPLVKAMLVLGVAIVGFFTISSTIPTGQSCRLQTCVNTNSVRRTELREAAQNALNAIGSTHTLTASDVRAGRGQHVFNNGLLRFHRNVLEDLLREVGGSAQLENLMQDLIIPLNRNVQNAISTMVVHFSSDDNYVDFNADLYGEFARKLRTALVAYLKAKTSDNLNERYGIQQIRQRVLLIATQMANHSVYVDRMARDRWLQENRRREEAVQLYNQVNNDLKIMFRDILQDFKKVSDKIYVFRKRNNWSWTSDLK